MPRRGGGALVDLTHPGERSRDSATQGHYSGRDILGSERGPVLDALAQQGLICPLRRGYTHDGAGHDPHHS